MIFDLDVVVVVVVLFCVECCVVTIVFDGYVNGGCPKIFSIGTSKSTNVQSGRPVFIMQRWGKIVTCVLFVLDVTICCVITTGTGATGTFCFFIRM